MFYHESFLIWQDEWSSVRLNDIYLKRIYSNNGVGVQEVIINKINTAIFRNYEEDLEQFAFVSIIKKQPDENIKLPVDWNNLSDQIQNTRRLNKEYFLYNQFVHLDRSENNNNPNIYVRLNSGESLYYVITPWTAPDFSVNCLIDYSIQYVKG